MKPKSYIVVETEKCLALRQQLGMEEPAKIEYHSIYYYQEDLSKYNDHIASLETIDIHPEYQGYWKKDDVVKEGEFVRKDVAVCSFYPEYVAIPKEQEKESGNEFLKILANRLLKYDEENTSAHDDGEYDKYNWQISGRIQELKFVIGQLKLHYHITKK